MALLSPMPFEEELIFVSQLLNSKIPVDHVH